MRDAIRDIGRPENRKPDPVSCAPLARYHYSNYGGMDDVDNNALLNR